MKWNHFRSNDLYILGIASLLIASKFNESGKISVERLILETATSFITKDDVFNMEVKILELIDF